MYLILDCKSRVMQIGLNASPCNDASRAVFVEPNSTQPPGTKLPFATSCKEIQVFATGSQLSAHLTSMSPDLRASLATPGIFECVQVGLQICLALKSIGQKASIMSARQRNSMRLTAGVFLCCLLACHLLTNVQSAPALHALPALPEVSQALPSNSLALDEEVLSSLLQSREAQKINLEKIMGLSDSLPTFLGLTQFLFLPLTSTKPHEKATKIALWLSTPMSKAIAIQRADTSPRILEAMARCQGDFLYALQEDDILVVFPIEQGSKGTAPVALENRRYTLKPRVSNTLTDACAQD